MNPQLTFDLDFSLFSSFFSSKKDDKEEKKKKESKKDQKKPEKPKTQTKENIVKKDSNKSSETTNTEEEEESKKINKKVVQKNQKNKKEEKLDSINEKSIIKEDKKEEKNIINDVKETKEVPKEVPKEEGIKNVNVINEEKKEKKVTKKKKNKKEKNGKNDLINFLIYYIKNIFLFRKKVKNLVQKQKENYVIISSVNKGDLTMNIKINEDEVKKIKHVYEPILNENIFYIPRKTFKRKNLLKFSFVNKKNESIIDPKFNTEYDEGEFINVINLKKIKDKEEEREEEFQTFLESYYTLKPAVNKETQKISLGVVRVKKRHKTMDSQNGGFSFGMHKVPSNSILKQRPIKRVTSNKKITFSEINETIAYKKDE